MQLDIQTTKLSSGLTVIRVPMGEVASVTSLLLCNTGSRYEDEQTQGIAHFFEHMVFKGTKQYPSAHQLSATIDGIGADFNAFTGKEYTGYYVKAASRHLEIALSVLSDMILHPLLKQEDIKREKGVIIEEINMYQDTPMRLVGNLFEQTFFGQSGLSHDILGTKETVSSISQSDFKTLLNQWYSLENMILVIAGDESIVGTGQTTDLIRQHFGTADDSRQLGYRDVSQLVERAEPHTGQLHLHSKQTEQSHFILAWPGLERGANERYALTVLRTIMGGTMSSRLFTEVREKRGLCYYVHADATAYHDAGCFGASAGVDPNRIDEALRVIRAEFEAVVAGTKPITTEELQRAQENVIGTTTLGLEDSRSIAQYAGLKQLLTHEIEQPEAFFEQIKAVTLDQVTQLLAEFLEESPTLAIVGPHKQPKQFDAVIE